MGIIFLAGTLIVLLATGEMIVFSTLTQHEQIVTDLLILAEITGDNCSAALSFKVVEDAERMLASLSAQPSIKLAVLYDAEQNVFAVYRSDDALSMPVFRHAAGAYRDEGRLYVCHAIDVDDSIVGTICLVDDLSRLKTALIRNISVMGGFAAVSLLLAYLLARLLHGIITRPLLSLAEAARAVTERDDYSVRAVAGTKDELGLLTQAFNLMLETIQAREQALLSANEALEAQIQEREKAKQALQDLNETLEQRVEHRTAELRRSNKELEQFAYVASHDLQEPLRTVASFAALLERRYKGQLGTDADEFIGFVMDGAMRAQSLINDLLQFSRVGAQTPEFEWVDCNKVVDSVLLDLQSAIGESGGIVSHDPLPSVWADRPQLIQLFQNLISNAIKFRKDDTPLEIHIRAHDRGEEWELTVKDNGIGIDEKYFDLIFIIFKRLQGRNRPGTGIGLAICRKIVEHFGGDIWVDSIPGRGSTFHFTLPKK